MANPLELLGKEDEQQNLLIQEMGEAAEATQDFNAVQQASTTELVSLSLKEQQSRADGAIQILSNTQDIQKNLENIDAVNNNIWWRLLQPATNIFYPERSVKRQNEQMLNSTKKVAVVDSKMKSETTQLEMQKNVLAAKITDSKADVAKEIGDVDVLRERINEEVNAANRQNDLISQAIHIESIPNLQKLVKDRTVTPQQFREEMLRRQGLEDAAAMNRLSRKSASLIDKERARAIALRNFDETDLNTLITNGMENAGQADASIINAEFAEMQFSVAELRQRRGELKEASVGERNKTVEMETTLANADSLVKSWAQVSGGNPTTLTSPEASAQFVVENPESSPESKALAANYLANVKATNEAKKRGDTDAAVLLATRQGELAAKNLELIRQSEITSASKTMKPAVTEWQQQGRFKTQENAATSLSQALIMGTETNSTIYNSVLDLFTKEELFSDQEKVLDFGTFAQDPIAVMSQAANNPAIRNRVTSTLHGAGRFNLYNSIAEALDDGDMLAQLNADNSAVNIGGEFREDVYFDYASSRNADGSEGPTIDAIRVKYKEMIQEFANREFSGGGQGNSKYTISGINKLYFDNSTREKFIVKSNQVFANETARSRIAIEDAINAEKNARPPVQQQFQRRGSTLPETTSLF